MEAHGYGNIFSLLLEIENNAVNLSNAAPKRTPRSSPSKTSAVRKSSDLSEVKSVSDYSISPNRIFAQYLSDDSPFKVRLPEELKSEIQSACCNEDTKYCFDNLREYMHQLIKKE